MANERCPKVVLQLLTCLLASTCSHCASAEQQAESRIGAILHGFPPANSPPAVAHGLPRRRCLVETLKQVKAAQNGEGGAVEAIFRCIGVSSSPQSVEVVAQEADAGQSSSSSQRLTEQHGFKGLRIGDASQGNQHQTATAENIQELLQQNQAPFPEVDHLSVAVGLNTFWVAHAVLQAGWRPRCLALSINRNAGPEASQVALYMPKEPHQGSCYFGASAMAMARMAAHFGYVTVAVGIEGRTLFLVHSSTLDPEPTGAAAVNVADTQSTGHQHQDLVASLLAGHGSTREGLLQGAEGVRDATGDAPITAGLEPPSVFASTLQAFALTTGPGAWAASHGDCRHTVWLEVGPGVDFSAQGWRSSLRPMLLSHRPAAPGEVLEGNPERVFYEVEGLTLMQVVQHPQTAGAPLPFDTTNQAPNSQSSSSTSTTSAVLAADIPPRPLAELQRLQHTQQIQRAQNLQHMMRMRQLLQRRHSAKQLANQGQMGGVSTDSHMGGPSPNEDFSRASNWVVQQQQQQQEFKHSDFLQASPFKPLRRRQLRQQLQQEEDDGANAWGGGAGYGHSLNGDSGEGLGGGVAGDGGVSLDSTLDQRGVAEGGEGFENIGGESGAYGAMHDVGGGSGEQTGDGRGREGEGGDETANNFKSVSAGDEAGGGGEGAMKSADDVADSVTSDGSLHQEGGAHALGQLDEGDLRGDGSQANVEENALNKQLDAAADDATGGPEEGDRPVHASTGSSISSTDSSNADSRGSGTSDAVAGGVDGANDAGATADATWTDSVDGNAGAVLAEQLQQEQQQQQEQEVRAAREEQAAHERMQALLRQRATVLTADEQHRQRLQQQQQQQAVAALQGQHQEEAAHQHPSSSLRESWAHAAEGLWAGIAGVGNRESGDHQQPPQQQQGAGGGHVGWSPWGGIDKSGRVDVLDWGVHGSEEPKLAGSGSTSQQQHPQHPPPAAEQNAGTLTSMYLAAAAAQEHGTVLERMEHPCMHVRMSSLPPETVAGLAAAACLVFGCAGLVGFAMAISWAMEAIRRQAGANMESSLGGAGGEGRSTTKAGSGNSPKQVYVVVRDDQVGDLKGVTDGSSRAGVRVASQVGTGRLGTRMSQAPEEEVCLGAGTARANSKGAGGGGGSELAGLLLPLSEHNVLSTKGSDDGTDARPGQGKSRVPSVVVGGGIGGTVARSPPSSREAGIGVHHRGGTHLR